MMKMVMLMVVLGQMAGWDEGGSLFLGGTWAVSAWASDRHSSQRNLARINTAKVSAASIRDAPVLSASCPVLSHPR